jgi:transposase-like protein
MKQDNTVERDAQAVTWETLERFVQGKAQEFIQEVLEAEVTELLGRGKSERRALVDAPPGYRNGHGKPRTLTLGSGTVTLQRPRVRGLEERFESRVLPLSVRRTQAVDDLLPELYLHGLAEGDFDSGRDDRRAAGAAGRGRPAVGEYGGATENEVAGGARGVECAAAG